MKKLFILTWLIGLLVAVPGFCADYTTAKAVLMDWTLLDDTAGTPWLETTELTTDTWMGCTLYVDVAHIDADAGTAATVKIWAKSGTTDECWHEKQELSVTMGAANAGDVDQICASAQANVYLAATANFDGPGDVFFLRDVGTLADSCLCIIGKATTDDYTTCIDNLVNAYDASDTTWDIVDQWAVRLGPGYIIKVTFDNTDSAANYACRVHYVAETDIE
ncbi:MAG: hypothetical protein KAV87_30600 [Desulfobacteraceae bacterium]|nr:hypothetical protein [Desulfobacteraceae bacterium]